MPDCVHASADGLSLEPCPPGFVPTIGAEINKLAFNIAMGVRHDSKALRNTLNKLIASSEPEINAILQEYGVPQATPPVDHIKDDDD